MYELKIAQYSGPLEKLLELIEERKLEITEISLAEVTDDFLKYLETLRAVDSGEEGRTVRTDLKVLADFIVVASRLVFIKSKSLLPDLSLTQEEEEDIKDLEHRLKLYRELRPAMKHLAQLWKEGESTASRPYFLNMAHWVIPQPPAGGTYAMGVEEGTQVKFFYPGRNLDLPGLQGMLAKLFDQLQSFTQESQVIHDKIVTLEEKIKEIVSRVKEIQATSFAHLSAERPKGEVIVTFLAILHLAREQLISLEQAGHLSDIIITKNEPSNV
jgi:segregation and condensation protein A